MFLSILTASAAAAAIVGVSLSETQSRFAELLPPPPGNLFNSSALLLMYLLFCCARVNLEFFLSNFIPVSWARARFFTLQRQRVTVQKCNEFSECIVSEKKEPYKIINFVFSLRAPSFCRSNICRPKPFLP